MSGGKGGKKTTSTQTVSVPPYLESEIRFGLEKARERYNQGVPEYFEDQTYAGFDPLQTEAMDQTVDLARKGSPLITGAQGFTQGVLDAVPGQNPYLDQMLAKLTADANSRVMGSFNASGRLGSGANVATSSKAVADAALPYLFNQYNTDVENKFRASALAPSLYEQDFINLNKIASVGDVKQSMTQNAIDEALARWQYETNAPDALLDQYLNRIAESPANNLTTTTNIQKTSGGSKLGSILGTALSIGSMFVPGGQFAALGGLGGMGSAMGFGLSTGGQGLFSGGLSNMIGAASGKFGPGF